MITTILRRLTVAVVLAVLTVACSAPAPAAPAVEQAVPPVVDQWAAAWNGNRPADMAALFTADAVYEDLAFQASWRGTDQIGRWVGLTHSSIDAVDARIDTAFRSGDRIAMTWTFSGQIKGAPRPFSVPATTVLELRGERIVRNRDYYNLAAVLRQSGLPADWNPSAG